LADERSTPGSTDRMDALRELFTTWIGLLARDEAKQLTHKR
jgi:hypothetical protein